MRKVKIAQIGTSGASYDQMAFELLKRQSDIFEIVGYTLPENEREKFPQEVKAFDGYPELTLDEILNNPYIEAVAVETEEIYLTKYALMAANSNKHIHMEKPGGMNLADFEKLIETVRKNSCVFHLGYMYRYNPYVSDLIDRAKSVELGEIIGVEAQMSCYYDGDSRKWLEVFGEGGMMFFLGCRLLDIIFRLQGTPVRIVPFNKSSNIDGTSSEGFCMAVFEYEKGVSFAAMVLGGREKPWAYHYEFALYKTILKSCRLTAEEQNV